MSHSHLKIAWCVAFVVLASALGFLLSIHPVFRSQEEKALDLFFNIRFESTDEKVPGVALVFIDDKALGDRYGYFDPIPRSYVAALVDTLARKGAHTIAIDLAFFDRMTRLDPGGDSLLVAAMQRAGNVVSVSILYPTEDDRLILQAPHPYFAKAMAGVGYANLRTSGGVGGYQSVRDLHLYEVVDSSTTNSSGQVVPAFSTAVYCHYRGIDVTDFVAKLQTTPAEIPLTGEYMTLNYIGPPPFWEKLPNGTWMQQREGNITTFRSSLLTGRISLPPVLFKDKVVFIGNGSEFARDQFVTPFYNDFFDHQLMRGAEVHANAFLNLVNRNPLRHLGSEWIAAIFLALTATMVLATVKLGLMQEILVALGLIAASWVGSYFAFERWQVWLPVVSFSVAIATAYFATSIYLGFTEERQRKKLREMFQRYAPPAYVDELIKDPRKLELGGEEKEITMIFSDIEGFTSISENMPPKQLVKLLNMYLEEMTRVIFERNGTLDKYIGDAIVAVFGAPLPQASHALDACLAALEMQKKLDAVRQKWIDAGYPRIRARIGINTGQVVFGNIGSEIRYDYTGIGDAVNLAARLESANKQYGTYTMLSNFTYERVKEHVRVRELDILAVKGKSEPVTVYELLGQVSETLPEPVEEMLLVYQEGLQYYRQQRWDLALHTFEKALAFVPDDRPSKMYIERCEVFQTEPPAADWDGIFRLHTK